ncbi:hypothetical protein FQR65_LT19255 [Abscondita terminalis]|nr:hypothetical protein FQR65_LT19255 [Abscondita terminalis]
MKKSALKFLEEKKGSERLLQIIEEFVKEKKDLNINELSKLSFLSPSGITRFFINNGFDGFKEFKYLLLNEYESIDKFYIVDSFENELLFEAINETKKLNNTEKYEEAYQLLLKSNRVFISVVGGNNSIDNHLNHVKLTNAKENDVLFAVSYSGSSKEVVESVKICKQKGIKVISITRIEENEVSKNADIKFYIDSTENLTRILSLKSRVNDLKKIDGVMGLVKAGDDEFQIVLGPGTVNKVAMEFEKIVSVQKTTLLNDGEFETQTIKTAEQLAQENKNMLRKKGSVSNFLSKVSKVFSPLIPAFIGAGILAGIAGILASTDGTAVLGAPHAGLIGAMIAVGFTIQIEKLFRRFMPGALDTILTPIFVLFIMILLNVVVIIPASGYLFTGISFLFENLYTNPFGASLLAGIFLFALAFGVHQGFLPIYFALIAQTGEKEKMQKVNLDSILTESINPNTENMDISSIKEIISMINNEDKKIALAIEDVKENISKVIEEIQLSFEKNGRLFYVGSGSSGRIGVLDASEMLPTYGVKDRIIGIIAGGDIALRLPVEGAEDDENQVIEDLKKYDFNSNDCVIAIGASGRTPYSIGAIKYAQSINAKAFGLCMTSNSEFKKLCPTIEVLTGAEPVTGSTRMKSGTATKMVLNIISTTLMVKMGKLYKNLMVDVKANNIKLQNRAIKIVKNITNCEDDQLIVDTLIKTNYNCSITIICILKGVDSKEAISLLEKNKNILRKVIG